MKKRLFSFVLFLSSFHPFLFAFINFEILKWKQNKNNCKDICIISCYFHVSLSGKRIEYTHTLVRCDRTHLSRRCIGGDRCLLNVLLFHFDIPIQNLFIILNWRDVYTHICSPALSFIHRFFSIPFFFATSLLETINLLIFCVFVFTPIRSWLEQCSDVKANFNFCLRSIEFQWPFHISVYTERVTNQEWDFEHIVDSSFECVFVGVHVLFRT